MSNQSNDFNTPPELIRPIKKFFGGVIELDPCSNKDSMVKPVVAWSLPIDGLNQIWHKVAKTVFVNPPYAPYYLRNDGVIILTPKEYNGGICLEERERYERYTIKNWLLKGVSEKEDDCELIYLIPARGSGSSVWQQVIFPCSDAICYLKERVIFWENGAPCEGPDGKINPATFDCVLVYFGKEPKVFRSFFKPMGYVVIQER